MPSMTPIPTGETKTIEIGGEQLAVRMLTGRQTARAIRLSVEVHRLNSNPESSSFDDEILDAVLAVLDAVLTEQAAARVKYRFNDATGPDVLAVKELFEAWSAVSDLLTGDDDADHPTNGSSDSPNGSTSTGPLSTDSPSGEEPTLPTSDTRDA